VASMVWFACYVALSDLERSICQAPQSVE